MGWEQWCDFRLHYLCLSCLATRWQCLLSFNFFERGVSGEAARTGIFWVHYSHPVFPHINWWGWNKLNQNSVQIIWIFISSYFCHQQRKKHKCGTFIYLKQLKNKQLSKILVQSKNKKQKNNLHHSKQLNYTLLYWQITTPSEKIFFRWLSWQLQRPNSL